MDFALDWQKIIQWFCCGTDKYVDPTNFWKISDGWPTRQKWQRQEGFLKGQDLFGESITIEIGPLRDQDVVWVGLSWVWKFRYWLQRMDDRRFGCAALWLTGDVSMWLRCVVLVRTCIWWYSTPLLGKTGAGLQLVLLLVGAGTAVGEDGAGKMAKMEPVRSKVTSKDFVG